MCGVKPRILAAFGGRLSVILGKVAQNLGLRQVGGRHSCAAMQRSARLIEVDRIGHIRGNHSIIAAWFGYAPAVSEQDNVCTTLLLVRKVPVRAGIQPLKNGLMCRVAVPVLKHRDTKMFWMRSL